MPFAIARNAQFKRNRECVYNGYTHAMKTAGYLIGILIKLTACMKLGHDNFGSRDAFLFVNANRNTTTVIGDRNRAIRIKRNRHTVSMSCKYFINTVINNLINHVVKTRAIIRIADIHARAFSYRIKALENLNGIRTVFSWVDIVFGCISHKKLPVFSAVLEKYESANFP